MNKRRINVAAMKGCPPIIYALGTREEFYMKGKLLVTTTPQISQYQVNDELNRFNAIMVNTFKHMQLSFPCSLMYSPG